MCIRDSVNPFYKLLDIARENSSVVVYASSAATYGSSSSPQTIGSESPENPYGFSKYIMDKIALNYLKKYPKMTISGLRYFNVYGSKEFYKDKTASMIIQLGHQILGGKSPKLFKESKNIFRDFIYINDVVQANIKACKPKLNGIFNIGTGKSRSFQEIADILQKELGTDLGTEYFHNPHIGYQMHTQADISLSEKYLDFKAKYTLEDGIRDYIPEIKQLYHKNL